LENLLVDASRTLSARISLFARWFAGIGLLVMTAIIGWQVFARYVLNASPAWAEQAALLLMIWYVMFAAAAGVREGFHIRIGLLENAVQPPLRRIIKTVSNAVVGSFGAAMVIWGADLVMETWSHDIPTLGLPRGVAYLPMPAAGVLIVYFSIEHIVALWRGREVKRVWN
jgi:TRAP-type C4-dicarboxylate transport system permease small subunit